ncbi:MAG TPA: S8 family serine peptidase, partial [bacterium]|nr:S8 family serine peptidase [bacterium]
MENRLNIDPAGSRGNAKEEPVLKCGRLIAGVTLLVLVTAGAAAGGTIHLATHPFDPANGEPAVDGWLRAEPPSEGQIGYYLVQLAGPSTDARKSSVEALGGELIAYVPDNTWITRLEGGRALSLADSPEVAWVGAFHPAYKISPTIGTHEFRNPKRAGDSFLTLHVRVFRDLAGSAAELERLGAAVLEATDDGFQKILVVHASREMVSAIARVANVWWIEEKPEFTVMNDTTKWVVQSNTSGGTPIWDHGLHGEDQLVAVMDSGLDYNSCWFRETGGAPPGPTHRKVVDYALSGGVAYDGCDNGHGTHVCGTLAGDQSY